MTLKERRAIAAAKGLCATCRKRVPQPTYKTCAICLHAVSVLQSKYRRRYQAGPAATANAFHVCCQSAYVHRTGCTEATTGHASRRQRKEDSTDAQF